MLIGDWMIISKEPFRFLLAVGVGNHSLGLLRKYKEAGLYFMPWNVRQRLVHAEYLSGREVKKANLLGFNLIPAVNLQHTRLVEGANTAFELVLNRELPNLSREFIPFVMDVVHTHGTIEPKQHQAILYLSNEDSATVSEEHWEYQK